MSKILEDIADGLDLPADAIAKTPKITIVGGVRVLVENHRGILAYSDECVELGGGKVHIRVRGSDLILRAMDSRSILISGKIFGVDTE